MIIGPTFSFKFQKHTSDSSAAKLGRILNTSQRTVSGWRILALRLPTCFVHESVAHSTRTWRMCSLQPHGLTWVWDLGWVIAATNVGYVQPGLTFPIGNLFLSSSFRIKSFHLIFASFRFQLTPKICWNFCFWLFWNIHIRPTGPMALETFKHANKVSIHFSILFNGQFLNTFS